MPRSSPTLSLKELVAAAATLPLDQQYQAAVSIHTEWQRQMRAARRAREAAAKSARDNCAHEIRTIQLGPTLREERCIKGCGWRREIDSSG